MQKVINVLGLVGFVLSAGLTTGVAVVYLNRDGITNNIKERITTATVEAITEALPMLLDQEIPELPGETGPYSSSMKIRNAILAGLFFGIGHGMTVDAKPGRAERLQKGYYSYDAMGCMLVKECTDGVERNL